MDTSRNQKKNRLIALAFACALMLLVYGPLDLPEAIDGIGLDTADVGYVRYLQARDTGRLETHLVHAVLSGADLTGADLSHANLGGAIAFEADLSSAVLRGAKLIEGAAEIIHHGLSQRGQAHPLRHAFEQCRPGPGFEGFDMLRHRARGYRKLDRRGLETAEAGGRFECP